MNCKGCSHQMKVRPECCFTKSGILSLENCLCETCLIKTVCSDVCDDFKETIQKDINFYCYEPQYIKECYAIPTGVHSVFIN